MKLLVDQNISFRVIKLLEKDFPESLHVTSAGLKNSMDIDIWNYAKKYGYIILTHDNDFDDILVKFGFPPKIIRLNAGNISTQKLVNLLQNSIKEIEEFKLSDDTGLMIISK
jgi:predicted nuclease of predicted toxin-antitoxin system